jgi:hypothetical protein
VAMKTTDARLGRALPLERPDNQVMVAVDTASNELVVLLCIDGHMVHILLSFLVGPAH